MEVNCPKQVKQPALTGRLKTAASLLFSFGFFWLSFRFMNHAGVGIAMLVGIGGCGGLRSGSVPKDGTQVPRPPCSNRDVCGRTVSSDGGTHGVRSRTGTSLFPATAWTMWCIRPVDGASEPDAERNDPWDGGSRREVGKACCAVSAGWRNVVAVAQVARRSVVAGGRAASTVHCTPIP